MKLYKLYIFIFVLFSITSCREIENNNDIQIIGNPDSACLQQYLSNNSVCKYVFNDMIECSIIINDSGPYHCFIKECVLNKKQIYYFTIDDVLKYNFIPKYDSLDFDLSLNYHKTEFDKIKWSSKFENISSLRRNSIEYNSYISTLNDADELSNFYNNSLFFQCNEKIVSSDVKNEVLKKLIEITQVQLVGKYLRHVPNDINTIVLGWRYVCFSYSILYWNLNQYGDFIDYINQLKQDLEHHKNLRFERNENIQEKKDIEDCQFYNFYYSKYLLTIQEQNLQNIINNTSVIIKGLSKYDYCISINYNYSDTRLIFFKITINNNNKILIQKDYFNKEFLPTTRISNYYLYF